jgi:hypothetical protein
MLYSFTFHTKLTRLNIKPLNAKSHYRNTEQNVGAQKGLRAYDMWLNNEQQDYFAGASQYRVPP